MTLFWLGAGWLTGLAAGDISPFTSLQWALLALISLIALIWTRQQPLARLLFGLALAVTLAGSRIAAANTSPPPTDLLRYNDLGTPIHLRGRISAFPQPESDIVSLTIDVSAIRAREGPWTDLSGRVLARASPFTQWQLGDQVELVGELDTPPIFENFSYREYLARRHVYSVMQVRSGDRLAAGAKFNPLVLLARYRSHALSIIHRLFPEPESSLLAGILLGLEGEIPDQIRADFNRTGTTHIIAISGFNISIVAGLFLALFGRWWGVRRGAWLAAAGIGVYTALVGADPAVVRAALMALLALMAQRLGRRADGYNALAAAAIIMTALDPYRAWDAGFQLSFAATLGLLIYGERLQSAFQGWIEGRFSVSTELSRRVSSPVSEYLLLTLAAQITTLPLMIYYFGRLSAVSPLANLLILPAQPAVMVTGGLATLLGSLWPPAGQLLAWFAWPFPAYTIQVVELLADLPAASLALPPLSLPGLLGLYAIIGIVNWLMIRRPTPARPALSTPLYAVSAAALALLAALTWQAVLDLPDRRLHVTVLDIPQGEAILIETADGRNLLINGGASAIALGQALDRTMSLFSRSLDWLVITASDDGSIGAIANLTERYPIGGLLVTAEPGGAAYQTLVESAQAAGKPVGFAEGGMRFEIGREQRLSLYDLGSPGFALLVESPKARVLLMPTALAGWIDQLPAALRAPLLTAVLLPASGDATLSPPDDVLALEPQLVLLAVGDGAASGLPSPALAEALSDHNLLRTDRNGWIEITLNGQILTAEVERAPSEDGED
ncbi:MAG: ComEC/Rec2 family competence protein [Anaerolineales bacterium]